MIKSQLTSVLFMFLFALSPIYGDFELLELVSTWPATFCYAYGCKRPIPNNFTIHGLWPDNKSTVLNFCNLVHEDEYIPITDHKILTKLDKRWPQLRYDYLYGIRKQYLWKNEFVKHGSCSINRYKQAAYFDLAMKIKDKFDLLGTLRNHGINPGSTYELDDIERAIMTVSIEVPSLKCIQKPLGNVELNEIGICLDPEAKYMVPCPRTGSCHNMGHKIKFR
ncbi:ribonuclease S-2-like [Solanum verrucosum]|uniref:ribonuclease S-2-like n=1 Tax=Solanum verrucosum TaxID=315347 RepID=UPI0020D0D731|nr:ribonuclease S-2-like [Solanum verrucosum]